MATATRNRTISINLQAAPPVITSVASAAGTATSPFSYAITGTNTPTNYSVAGVLPTGLTVNSATGVISGTPSQTGTFNVTIQATNGSGTGSLPFALTINAASAPSFVVQPANQLLNVNASGTTLAGGGWHSVAIMNDGTLRAWGMNQSGQLGDGTTTSRSTPVSVAGLTGIKALAVGYDHALAVKPDGTVWVWGSNSLGALGVGSSVPFSSVPVQISGLGGVVAVAAGFHSLALKSDGTVWAWGYNVYGQVGDGTVVDRNAPVMVGGLSGIVAIAAGGLHSFAMKSDGTVWSWGANWGGQLGFASLNNFLPGEMGNLGSEVRLVAGGMHNLAKKNDGTVWVWGKGSNGQLGTGTNYDSQVPLQVAGLAGYPSLAAGPWGHHSVGRKTDGTVWGWGYNAFGQMGDGTSVDRYAPVQMTGMSGGAVVAAGYGHSLVAKGDGTAWTSGMNWFGQLGDGTFVDRTTAVQVTGLTGVALPEATPATFTVIASGSPAPIYQWQRKAVGQATFTNLVNSPTFSGVTSASLGVLGATATMEGDQFRVVVTNAVGSATSTAARLTQLPFGPTATHTVDSGGGNPGGTVTIRSTINFAGAASALGWKVVVPPGWSYASGTGEGSIKPVVDATENLEWAWSIPLTGPVVFTYTLAIPASASGSELLYGSAIVRQNDLQATVAATSDPLVVGTAAVSALPAGNAALPALPSALLPVPTFHSADTNHDYRISLSELTRVIELYNVRHGTVRTGAYVVMAGTEDGFSPDASVVNTTVRTLSSYHAADADQNGNLSLPELTRVIEIYNFRTGTTRTGEYHVQAGTEDGFAPGPDLPFPVIGGLLTGSGTYGAIFSHPLTATNAPSSFSATGLPTGLVLTTTTIPGTTAVTAAITGAPTQVGEFVVLVRATNATGLGLAATLTLTIGKGTPVLTFPYRTFTNEFIKYITLDMLNATVTGVSGLPLPMTTGASAITYKIKTGAGSVGAPAGSNPLGKYLTPAYSPITITASYPGDNFYAAVSVDAVFTDEVVYTPTAPADVRQVLTSSSGFSLTWKSSGGAPPKIGPNFNFEISLDGGATVFTTITTGRLSAVIDGRPANTTYQVVLRGRDEFGNESAWSAPLPVTTLASGMAPVTNSQWIELSDHGLKDEVIDAGTAAFFHEEGARTSQSVTYTDWVQYWSYIPGFSYTGSSYTDGYGGTYFVPGQWVYEWVVEEQEILIPLVRPLFHFVAQPGYDYRVGRLFRRTNGDFVFNEIFSVDSDHTIDGINAWWPTDFWSEARYYAVPFVLVRTSKPIGSVSLAGQFATVTVGTVRGLGGILNVPFPGTGNVVISLKDLANQVLKAGPKVVWDVWEGINQIRVGTSTVGDLLDLGINTSGEFQVGLKLDDSTKVWFNVSVQPPPAPKLAVDANRDGTITFDAADGTSASAPYRFWLNDDDDNADSVADAMDGVVNGADDLEDFFPAFLDLKSLVAAMPPSSTVKYKLRQDDGALNFVYTNLTRATAFSYVGGSLTTGFGPSFNQAASSATVQQVTASGVELSADFLNRIASQDQGVILMEGRQVSDKPLVLSVEKDGAVVAEARLELVAMHLGKLWETSNKANQIFNRTKKDDSTGNLAVLETEGDATYAAPRNNLYVVADSGDNKLKVSLDLGIPATSRNRFLVAAWDGAAKVTGSDAAFPTDASQPATLQIAATSTAATKEYRLKLGVDANGNGLLDEGEATPLEIYRRKSTGELRFATVKGISNAKYAEHKTTLESKINYWLDPSSQPTFPAKYARSFLSLFYYQGDFGRIVAGVRPNGASGAQPLDAFASGAGYAEWLTHNSGATFTDAGQATIQDYRWTETSEVAEFFALRTPFALESTVTNAQGYVEFQTATGTTLKTFYNAQVKAAAEQALQNSPVGTALTFPLDGGWYEFPRAESPNLFKSISPGNWVTPSTQIVGMDDGYSGFGALFTDIFAGTDQFKDFDAFGTIGRGRVRNPRYRFTVKKEDTGIIFTNIEYKVSAVQFTCDVEDLYDFNYEDGTLPSHAAAMQLGWGKGANGPARDQGKIYRHQIHLDKTYAYPFDQAVLVIPGP